MVHKHKSFNYRMQQNHHQFCVSSFWWKLFQIVSTTSVSVKCISEPASNKTKSSEESIRTREDMTIKINQLPIISADRLHTGWPLYTGDFQRVSFGSLENDPCDDHENQSLHLCNNFQLYSFSKYCCLVFFLNLLKFAYHFLSGR